MTDPCMSCGEDRRLPAPEQCLHKASHSFVDCTPEHGVGHIDCPKCWYRSPRNPNSGVS